MCNLLHERSFIVHVIRMFLRWTNFSELLLRKCWRHLSFMSSFRKTQCRVAVCTTNMFFTSAVKSCKRHLCWLSRMFSWENIMYSRWAHYLISESIAIKTIIVKRNNYLSCNDLVGIIFLKYSNMFNWCRIDSQQKQFNWVNCYCVSVVHGVCLCTYTTLRRQFIEIVAFV